MKNLKYKIITGYNKDQYKIISAEEVHKAYYLFMNPTARTVFSNGTPLIGSDVKDIRPDYHSCFGWNSTHELDNFDWNEINNSKFPSEFNEITQQAKTVAEIANTNKNVLSKPLSEALLLLN